MADRSLPTPFYRFEMGEQPLPKPRFYRSVEDLEKEEVCEKQRDMLDDISLANVQADVTQCTHPSEMMDDGSNTCCACGAYAGKQVAATTEKSCYNGVFAHAMTSAAASAAARKKRRELSRSMADSTVYFETEAGVIIAAKKRDIDPACRKRRLATSPRVESSITVIDANGDHQTDVGMLADQDIQPVDFKVLKLRGAMSFEDYDEICPGLGTLSSTVENKPVARRAAIIASIVGQIMSAGDVYTRIPTTAFCYQDAIPCEVMLHIQDPPEDSKVKFMHETFKIVVENSEYFNSPQRRRLHHLSAFVAIVVAHIRLYHKSTHGVEECLELDRVRARCKPSQGRFAKRAMICALSAALKISYTCTTRLVQEAFDLQFPSEE